MSDDISIRVFIGMIAAGTLGLFRIGLIIAGLHDRRWYR